MQFSVALLRKEELDYYNWRNSIRLFYLKVLQLLVPELLHDTREKPACLRVTLATANLFPSCRGGNNSSLLFMAENIPLYFVYPLIS